MVFPAFDPAVKTGMCFRWRFHASESDCLIHIDSLDSDRKKWSRASSVIRRRGSLPSSGAQKNGVRRLWRSHRSWYDRKRRRVRDLSCGDTRIYLEFEVRRVHCRSCGSVKRERLDLLADNPFYTKRFATFVGRRCRDSSIKDVAQELHLDWQTVKELEKQYMREQLARAGTPGPKVIGIDEISIRKGHNYRIVVSDLVRRRPIWFGGEDRSEASMEVFYAWSGRKEEQRIRLAVMDMWKPFRNATRAARPAGRDPVRQVPRHAPSGRGARHGAQERYARLAARTAASSRARSTRCSRTGEPDAEGRQALKTLLAANKRLNTAYLLKESFGQLWDYEREGWARRFFENWRTA